MNLEQRRQLLETLLELSERFPDWRLGQMITNLATHARGPEVESIWDAEDEELLDAAREYLANRADAATTH